MWALFEIVTPRSFTLVTACIGLLLIVTALKEYADLEKLTCNSLHLVSFNWNLFVSACLASLSTASYFHLVDSCGLSRPSITHRRTSKDWPHAVTLMSFIMTRKSQGLNLVPCGTPTLTDPQSEQQSWANFTRCFLSVRNSAFQSNTQGGSS